MPRGHPSPAQFAADDPPLPDARRAVGAHPRDCIFPVLLMFGLPLATWLRLLVWLILGLAIYFGYGHRHSVTPEAPAE